MKRFGLFGILLIVVLSFITSSVYAAEVGYKSGFFIKGDEGFQLKINGRLQPRLEFTKKQTEPKKTLGFKIRRADLIFKGQVNEWVSFTMDLRHSTNSKNFNTVNLIGTTATYAPIPEFSVTAGMVGLPLDLMNEMSSAWYLLPEPPVTMTQSDGATSITASRKDFGVPDGLGVNLSGEISKFFYSVSGVNGSESNYGINNNMRMSFGARTGMNILGAVGGSMSDFERSSDPNLTVSVGGMYQTKRLDTDYAEARNAALTVTNSVAPEIKYILTGSGGVALRWLGLSVQSEAYYRKTRFSSFGSLPAALQFANLTDFGYYGAVGYYIVPKCFEAALQAGQIFRQGPDNNANQVGAGLNWYVFNNNLKLQLAYTWTEDYDDIQGRANNNVHQVILNAHTTF